MTATEPSAPQTPRGTIYLWPDSLMLAGRLPANRTHRHVPASLLCSPGAGFALEVNGRWRETRAALVAPEVPQALDPKGQLMLVIHLEPDGHLWRALLPLLDGEPSCDLPGLSVDQDMARLAAGVSAALARDNLESLIRGLARRSTAPMDQRIGQIIEHLHADLPERLDVTALGAQVGLSESRLRHLFRDETGVTLRRFLLHLKMRRVFSRWRPGVSLTELAAEAGFYDQPHLTRAARDMYDALPSAYIAAGSFSIIRN